MAPLLQNELKSDVARFTSRVQTFLATNQVVPGCEKLLQKAESGTFFARKFVHVALAQSKLVLQQVTKRPYKA